MWMLPGTCPVSYSLAWRTSMTSGAFRGDARSRRSASSSTFSRPVDSSGPPPSAHAPNPPRRWPTTRPSAPIRSAWRIASSQSPGRSRTRTSGRSGSTTQPSHVPNDGPSGTFCEPAAWATEWSAGGRRSRRRAPPAIEARVSSRLSGRGAGIRPPRRGGPAWLVGRIRAKYRGTAGWPRSSRFAKTSTSAIVATGLWRRS